MGTTTAPPSDLRDKLAVAKAQPAEGKSLIATIKDMAPELMQVTKGTPLDGERFMRIALTELRKNESLLACSRASVLGGIMCSAQLGLEIGSALGQSWLIPFRNKGVLEAQWIIGYKGIVSLAARSGVHISGRAVHEADEFSYEIVDGRDVINHTRELRGDRGEAWLWYATAHWGTDGYTAVVLNRSEVEAFRKRSKAKDSGPWVTDYSAMAVKTCVRRLTPWIPMTPQVSDAVAVDGQVVRGGFGLDLAELAAEHRELEAGSIDTTGEEPAAASDGDGEAGAAPDGGPPANADGEPAQQTIDTKAKETS